MVKTAILATTQWLCLTLSVSHLVALILPAPLAALGGHKLFQAELVCDNPLQLLHLSVVLGEVLHGLLPHHGHLGLSLHPEVERFIKKISKNQDNDIMLMIFTHYYTTVSNLTWRRKQRWTG